MFRLLLNVYSVLVIGWAEIMGIRELMDGKPTGAGFLLIIPLLFASVLNLTVWRKSSKKEKSI